MKIVITTDPKGKTSDHMNYGASKGWYNKGHMQAWCDLANKTLYSIQWSVETSYRRQHGLNIVSPVLVSHAI